MARSQSPSSTPSVFSLLLVIFVVAILYFAKEVLIPFTLAVLVSFVLAPLVDRLEHWRLGRIPAVVLTVLMLFALIAGLGWIVTDQMVDLADNLPSYKNNILQKVHAINAPGDGVLGRAKAAIDELSNELSDPKEVRAKSPAVQRPATPGNAEPVLVEIVAGGSSPMSWLTGMVSPVLGALGTAGVVLLFVLFMLIEREDLRNRLIRLIGTGKINATTQALDDAARRVSRYLLMQLIVNASYGLIAAVGLYFIGVPNAILWGLLAGILRYVPYIGPWIAASIPITISLAVFDTWTPPLMVVGFFIVLELVSNNILEPLLYRSSTGVSTIGVLVAAVFWTWLWGGIGLVMAMPLTVCLAVLGRYVPQLEFFNVLLTDEPVLPPEARYYQRLLADDEEEASALVEKRLSESSPLDVYDTVLLPALTLAEQDARRGALSEGRQAYIRDSMLDMLEDLADRGLFERPQTEEAGTESDGARKCVMCLPARDEADEIACVMLSHLLAARGHCVQHLSIKSLASEMIERIAQENVDVVFVSAVPPFAVAHARYLGKRLRTRFPELKIVTCLWHTPDNGKKLAERLRTAATDKVVTTLKEAVEQV